jgi:hypothetical protein
VAGFPIDLPGRQPVLGFPRWLVRTLEIVVPRRLLVQAVQPEVLRVSRKACLQRVWPAKPLEPGGDLGVVQVRMVTAAWADELEPVGVAAFHPAVHYGHRLAPQAGRLAMAGLAGHRKSRHPRRHRAARNHGHGAGYPESRRLPNGQNAHNWSRQPDLSYSFVPLPRSEQHRNISYVLYIQKMNIRRFANEQTSSVERGATRRSGRWFKPGHSGSVRRPARLIFTAIASLEVRTSK